MTEKATKHSWKVLPMDEPKLFYVNLRLTPSHFEKLQFGFIPKDMDDKCFAYYENDWIYIYRSWTGYEVFKAKIHKDGDGYAITEYYSEANQEKFNLPIESSNVNLFCSVLARKILQVELCEIQ